MVAALIAAVIHTYFFLLESIWFSRPRVWARFGLKSAGDAAIARSWAYNQGFYNLFLAIGIAVALTLVWTGETAPGLAIAMFVCGSMVAAGGVLLSNNHSYLRVALIQSVPPAVSIGAVWLLG